MKRLFWFLLIFILGPHTANSAETSNLKTADIATKCQARLEQNRYVPLLAVPAITQQTSLLAKERQAGEGVASYYYQIYLESCWLEEVDVNLERFCPVAAVALECYLDLLDAHMQAQYVSVFFLINGATLGIEKIHRNKEDENLEMRGPSMKREVAIRKLLRAASLRAWVLKALDKRLPLINLLPTARAYPLEEFDASIVTAMATMKDLLVAKEQIDTMKFREEDRVESSLVALLERARLKQWSQQEIVKTIQHLDQIEQHLATVTEGNLEQSYQLIELHRENGEEWKLLSQFFLPFRIIFTP